jgi:hypothetical protein
MKLQGKEAARKRNFQVLGNIGKMDGSARLPQFRAVF